MKPRKPLLAAALAAIALSAPSHAVVIDTFSGDLSAYTSTVILDANGGASNSATWQINGGALEYVTSTYDGIEQSVLVRGGLTLAVGEELQIDVSKTGNQDIGLYVGGTIPITGVRENYLNVYARSTTEVLSRGFVNGIGEISLHSQTGITAYDKLFIMRDGVNDYELGYYDGTTRVVVSNRDNITGNDASVVGIYTDVRAAGTLGTLDNLAVVPEPSVALLGCLGSLAMFRRRRG